MNEKLTKEHKARLTKPYALELYDQLCATLEERPGGMDDVSQGIVADVAMLEEMKILLYEDVAKRGVNVRWNNGRQGGTQENKSLNKVRQTMEQQRRHLNELKLTPASQKRQADAPAPEKILTPEDEFDAFPDS